MSQIEIDRNPKGQKIPGKVAFVATLLLPILGAACLVMPEPVAEHLPHLLGSVMLFVGAADIVTDILERNSNPGKITVGTDVVMIVLGIVTLLNTHESLNVIAVMWGLLGLENAAAEIDESLKAYAAGHKWIAPLASSWCSAPCCCSRPLPTWAIMSCCSVWSSWFIRSTLPATRNSRARSGAAAARHRPVFTHGRRGIGTIVS